MITLGNFSPQLEAYRAKRQQEEEAQVMQSWEDGYVSSNVLPRYKAYIQEAIARSLPMTYKDCWRCACSAFRRMEREYWAFHESQMPSELFAEQPLEPAY